ncbi:MAG: hypothetical protein VX608_01000, partial [Chloroflexota bacterium]|nr:hypothetical protein [Chloroflexota bacterium]
MGLCKESLEGVPGGDYAGRRPAQVGQVLFEMQEWRGVPHIHALVAGVDPGIRRMDMVDWAWTNYGQAR